MPHTKKQDRVQTLAAKVAVEHKPKTRIQKANEAKILKAALKVFSGNGFTGATLDQIAQEAGMSKPNLIYYFPSKEAIHTTLLDGLLDDWLRPLKDMNPEGDPQEELRKYIRQKLEMSRDYPMESRLFADEIMRGGPGVEDRIRNELRSLVDEKAQLVHNWIEVGKLYPCDPHHLIFSIWATTQHYADFDVQVQAVLAEPDRIASRFEDAIAFLETLYLRGLAPTA